MRDKTFGSQNRDISRLQSRTADSHLPEERKNTKVKRGHCQTMQHLEMQQQTHPGTGAGDSGQAGRHIATTGIKGIHGRAGRGGRE